MSSWKGGIPACLVGKEQGSDGGFGVQHQNDTVKLGAILREYLYPFSWSHPDSSQPPEQGRAWNTRTGSNSHPGRTTLSGKLDRRRCARRGCGTMRVVTHTKRDAVNRLCAVGCTNWGTTVLVKARYGTFGMNIGHRAARGLAWFASGPEVRVAKR